MIPVYSDAATNKIAEMFKWKGWDSIDAPLLTSLLIMLVLLVLGIVIGIRFSIAYKRKEYLERPKGFMHLVEIYHDTCAKFVRSNMGPEAGAWAGYFWTLFAYLFIAINASLFGLPSVIDWLAGPLSLAVVMFVLIQATALKYQGFGYFHRYIEPIPIFLPVNLITMWAPIISTTMRLFGNCLAGTIICGLAQWALSLLSNSLFGLVGIGGEIASLSSYWNQFPYWTGIFLAPIPLGTLNLYFGLFSGFIQTLVFGSLTALWIAQERPEAPAVSSRAAGVQPGVISE